MNLIELIFIGIHRSSVALYPWALENILVWLMLADLVSRCNKGVPSSWFCAGFGPNEGMALTAVLGIDKCNLCVAVLTSYRHS